MRPNAVIYTTSIDNGSYGSKVLRTPAAYKNSGYPPANSTIVQQPCPGIGPPLAQWNNYHINNINTKLPPHISASQRYPAPVNLTPPSSHAQHHPQNGSFNVLRPSFQGNLPPNAFPMANGLGSCYSVPHYPNPNMMQTNNGYNAGLNNCNVNQQRINECAGIPLISNATSHLNASLRQRQILRKMPLNTSQTPPWPVCNNAANFNNQNLGTKTLSQMAAHAQGSPLFANKDHKPTHWPGNNNMPPAAAAAAAGVNNLNLNGRYPNQNEINLNSNYQNSSLQIQSKENVNEANNLSSSLNEQQAMEAKDSNETCLPRIIKPRKRRKKDRKTANGGLFVKIVPDFKEPTTTSSSSSPSMETKIQKDEAIFRFPKKNHQHFLPANHQNQSLQNHHDCHLSEGSKKCLIKENLRPSPDALHHIDEVHGICFCNECDPLQSIWDYPLRSSSSELDSSDVPSSLSRSSSSSSSFKSKSSSPSTLSDFSTEHIAQQNGDILNDRAEFVGVIGSQRNNYFSLPKTTNNLDVSNETNNKEKASTCYNDILSGLNIATDLFHKTNKCLLEVNHEESIAATLNLHLGLLPETAETLLTESINEISRKLIETCSNESLVKMTMNPKALATSSLGSFSTCSSSDFSNDSGIETNGSGSSSINSSAGRQVNNNCCNELIFNFDSLHLIDDNNNQSTDPKTNNNSNANSGKAMQFPAKGKAINDIVINHNNNKSQLYSNASSNDINFHFPSSSPSPSTLASHSPASSSSSPSSPESLTFDFLLDMNNNTNKNNNNHNNNNNNEMGLSSYYDSLLYNYNSNKLIEDLKPKSKFLSPNNVNDSFDLLAWQNDTTFDEDHEVDLDINFSNLSFFNNLEDNFKIPTYSITSN